MLLETLSLLLNSLPVQWNVQLCSPSWIRSLTGWIADHSVSRRPLLFWKQLINKSFSILESKTIQLCECYFCVHQLSYLTLIPDEMTSSPTRTWPAQILFPVLTLRLSVNMSLSTFSPCFTEQLVAPGVWTARSCFIQVFVHLDLIFRPEHHSICLLLGGSIHLVSRGCCIYIH